MAKLEQVFRDNLRRCLRAKGMTQRELAKRLGVSDASVSELINGGYSPSLETIEKVASVLNEGNLTLLIPVEEISDIPVIAR